MFSIDKYVHLGSIPKRSLIDQLLLTTPLYRKAKKRRVTLHLRN
ncbi:hypothetical protein [Nostoc sp. KVJ3]|nr:hypothetical protein [Nostoc sp. KVJ3]